MSVKGVHIVLERGYHRVNDVSKFDMPLVKRGEMPFRWREDFP
jgi:hypothetical protein